MKNGQNVMDQEKEKEQIEVVDVEDAGQPEAKDGDVINKLFSNSNIKNSIKSRGSKIMRSIRG